MKLSLSLAVMSLSIFTGAAAMAQSSSADSVLQNPAAASTLHEIFTTNGVIMYVENQGEAAQAFSPQTMMNIGTLCENTDNPAVKLTVKVGEGLPVTVKDFDVLVAGKDSGYDCPLPAVTNLGGFDVDGIAAFWEMYRGHGANEFTQADLRAVLNQIRKQPTGEMLTRTDIPRGYWGNDLPHIKDVINGAYGQPTGWIVNSTGEYYMVVHNQCVTTCEGKRPFSVYHLHAPKKVVKKKGTKSKTPSKTKVTLAPRPLPRVIPMTCGSC